MPIQIVVDEERNVYEWDGSKIYFRRFDSKAYQDIVKKNTITKGYNKKSGSVDYDTDNNGVNDDLLDWMVIDWTNVQHPITEEILPCTREWKLKLPAETKNEIVTLAGGSKANMEKVDGEKKTLKRTPNTPD